MNAVQNELVLKLSNITREILNTETLEDFEFLISGHEKIISQTLELPTAKELHFSDYWGEIKSLGAWGGDFILATSSKTKMETVGYFANLGHDVVIPYAQMVREPSIQTRPAGSILH